MTATALDSVIFCDIFSTPQMRRVFSDEARTGYCLEFEAALARAQAHLGIIQPFQSSGNASGWTTIRLFAQIVSKQCKSQG